MKLVRLALAILFAAAFPARAIVVNNASTLAEAAALAADVADYPVFASAGSVQIQEGAFAYCGTGILVAPDWVLTAAHNWDTGAVTGLSFTVGGQTYSAQNGQWFQQPQWVASPNVGPDQGADIALFHLDRSVSGAVPVSIYTGKHELGASVVVLGTGLAGTAATGPQSNPAKTLYAERNIIDRAITFSGPTLTGGLLVTDFDDGSAVRNSLSGSAVYDTLGHSVSSIAGGNIASQSSAATVVTLEGTTAPGDSGGPAFADFGSGLQLVGLVSWGVNPTAPGNLYGSGYGDAAYFTQVSAFNGWITATIPEPGVLPLVAVSLIAWVLLRRKFARQHQRR